MSFCKKIVCFLTPRQVLRKGLLGLFLAGFALLAGSVWAEAINTESATAKYVAPFEMASSQAAASPRQVERAVKATLTDDQRIAAEVAAGKINLDDQVMMSERAWREGGAGTDGSYSGFPVNQTARLEEMEKGMAIQSGNDAAIALAEHVAGSQEAFAELMNSYAAKIGMKDSHFVNAHGLTAEGHQASAYDLALLGRALVRDYPETYAYNKVKEFTVGSIRQHNRNLLLWRDPSVDGIKTGHTAAAGYCLLSSAQRGDQRLIVVLLGGASEKQRADDSLALLNWGFRFHETHRLYEPATAITTQKVWKGQAAELQLGVAQPLLVTVPRGRYDELKAVMDVPRELVAPFAAGQQVGTVKVSLDDKVIAQAPLVAVAAVEEAGFFKRLWHSLLMWWNS